MFDIQGYGVRFPLHTGTVRSGTNLTFWTNVEEVWLFRRVLVIR